jgi:hypothetical protein
MLKKLSLELEVALVLLAVTLIYMGVNYVPRASASSTAQNDLVLAGKKTSISPVESQPRLDYLDHRCPRAIVGQLSYPNSDWVERYLTNH